MLLVARSVAPRSAPPWVARSRHIECAGMSVCVGAGSFAMPPSPSYPLSLNVWGAGCIDMPPAPGSTLCLCVGGGWGRCHASGSRLLSSLPVYVNVPVGISSALRHMDQPKAEQ
eukprot:364542-Chlamydomonas_euryale.AAC.15